MRFLKDLFIDCLLWGIIAVIILGSCVYLIMTI